MCLCAPASIIAPKDCSSNLSHRSVHPWVCLKAGAAPTGIAKRTHYHQFSTIDSPISLRRCTAATECRTELRLQIEQTNPIFMNSSQSSTRCRCWNAWSHFRSARQWMSKTEQTNPIFTKSSQFTVRFRRRDQGRDVVKASKRTHWEFATVLRFGRNLGILGIGGSGPRRDGSPDLNWRRNSLGDPPRGHRRLPGGRAIEPGRIGHRRPVPKYRETNHRWDHPARPARQTARPDQPRRLSHWSVIPARRVNS
jgi:hypothetical protein